MNIHSVIWVKEMTPSNQTLSAREQAAQDKEARVLAAALSLFAERGYHGTAVPEVASRAGVGTGTIYRYFENKEELVNAVFRTSKTRLKQVLLPELDFMATPRALFSQFWKRLVHFAQTYPTDFHFLELQDHSPYLDTASKAVEREVLTPIWAFCESQRQAGVFHDMPADTMIAMIWGAFVGLVKAQTHGYLVLSESGFEHAESACWRLIARDADNEY